MKEIDIVARSQFLRMFLWLFYPSIFVGGMAFLVTGRLIILIGSILFSIIMAVFLSLFINRVAGVLGSLQTGVGNKVTLEEQLAGELDKCRYLKSEKRFEEALQTANFILEQMPEHADALLLKAQLLSQSFADYKSARECLRQIIRLNLPADNTVRKWAKEMLTEVNMLLQEQRKKQIDEEKTKLRDATDALH